MGAAGTGSGRASTVTTSSADGKAAAGGSIKIGAGSRGSCAASKEGSVRVLEAETDGRAPPCEEEAGRVSKPSTLTGREGANPGSSPYNSGTDKSSTGKGAAVFSGGS